MNDVVCYVVDVVKCFEACFGKCDHSARASLVVKCVESYWSSKRVSGCCVCSDASGVKPVVADVGAEVSQVLGFGAQVDRVGCRAYTGGSRFEQQRDSEARRCSNAGVVSDSVVACGVNGVRDCNVGGGVSQEVVGDANHAGVDGGAVELGQSQGPSLSSRLVGKHWRRNARKKEARKVRKVSLDNELKSHALESKGFFSGCSVDVRSELRESRARMLIARNNLAVSSAEATLEKLKLEKTARVGESRFELGRLTLEEKLDKISVARGVGSVKTVVSSSSSVPSLSSGSVSPNSSISLAEERALRRENAQLVEEVAELKKSAIGSRAEFQEYDVDNEHNFPIY